MIWDKVRIRLFLLIIKEHCRTISLGMRGISLYIPWITNALKGILVKSLILTLFIIAPVAELVFIGAVFFYIIAFLI